MPVYTPKYTLTIKCKKCGWSKDYKRGGYGDVPNSPQSLKKFLRDIKSEIEACPKCGSEELAGEKRQC